LPAGRAGAGQCRAAPAWRGRRGDRQWLGRSGNRAPPDLWQVCARRGGCSPWHQRHGRRSRDRPARGERARGKDRARIRGGARQHVSDRAPSMACMTPPPRILIVEDEADIVFGLQEDLRRQGYETSVAADGEEAIRRGTSEVWDLIVLDVMLP